MVGTYSEDSVDVDSVAITEQEEVGLNVVAVVFELRDTTFDTGVEGEERESFADLGFGTALVVQLDKQACTQVGKLL